VIKYRTTTESDNIRENVRSSEMAKSLNTLNGRTGSAGRSDRSRSTFVPPKLGTTSKTKKIERRAWEKEQTQLQTRESEPHLNSVLASSVVPAPESNDDPLLETIHTLQEKYEQNLLVIEQLFLEKKQMAKKVEILEHKLQHTVMSGAPRGSSSPSPSRPQAPVRPPRYSSRPLSASTSHERVRESHPKVHPQRHSVEREKGREWKGDQRDDPLNLTSPAVLQNRYIQPEDDDDLDDDLDHQEYAGDQSFPESNQLTESPQNDQRNISQSQTLSALQAAELFANDPSLPLTSRSAKSLPTRSVYEPSPDHRSGVSRGRPSSAPRSSSNYLSSRNSSPSMSRSMTRSNSLRRSGPSPQLQAETDR
jgi:hypothetical protein